MIKWVPVLAFAGWAISQSGGAGQALGAASLALSICSLAVMGLLVMAAIGDRDRSAVRAEAPGRKGRHLAVPGSDFRRNLANRT